MRAKEAYEYLKSEGAEIEIRQEHPFDPNTSVCIRIHGLCFYAYGAIDLVHTVKVVKSTIYMRKD